MARGKSGRIYLLDELRGFAIICMVFFHAFYTAGYMFGFKFGYDLYNLFLPAQPFFAALFLIISGIASNLSRSNLKRGLVLFAISIALTFATYAGELLGFEGIVIWFGILHLLSVSIIFIALFRRGLNLIHPIVGMLICLAFFYITYNIEASNGHPGYLTFFSQKVYLPDWLYQTHYLCPFGFYNMNANFYSADYFPIFPWFFIFLFGYFLGMYAKKGKFPRFCYNQHIRPLAFVGKHTLWVYILHQPVICGLFWAVDFIISHI